MTARLVSIPPSGSERGTEQLFAGGPTQPVKHGLLRLAEGARRIRPKQMPLFSHVGAPNPINQQKQGYQELRSDGNNPCFGDLLRGNFDTTVVGRAMPGSLRLGINADAYAGLPQMRNYKPRATLKAEVSDVMRPGGAVSLTANSVNGYNLHWRPKSHKRSALIVKELDPQVQLANLARNPLAGPLPLIQRTDAVFQTGCDTIPMCALSSPCGAVAPNRFQ